MTTDKTPNASWIWYDDPGYDIINAWMRARYVFELDNTSKVAIIHVTADTRYRLWVNGHHVARGPARGYQHHWPYDTIDIAPYLKPGKNLIAALVTSYGTGTYGYISAGRAGFLLWGNVRDIDVSTGDNWRVSRSPGYLRTLTRASKQLSFIEIFDARRDNESWRDDPDYDVSGWKAPRRDAFGSMPWPNLEPRGIPMFREYLVPPAAAVSVGTGQNARGARNADNIVDVFTRESRKWSDPKPDMVRLTDNAACVRFPPVDTAQHVACVLDFGKEVIGSVELNVTGAATGAVVDYLVTESVDGRVPEFNAPSAGSRMAFGNRLILRSGDTRHEQFEHWGFRYLVLVVRYSKTPITVSVALHFCAYPLDIAASFHTSDPKLNRIFDISAWTQQCCMLDAYVDCPWREQAQWWGDARVQAANTAFLSADARLLKRGIRQIGQQTTPDGLTYGHAPTIGHHCVLPDFTLTWVMTHWDYWWQTGDTSLFQSMKTTVRHALDYFHTIRNKTNGLVPHDRRTWLFLDWTGLFKDGYPTVYNLMYLMALRAGADMFARVGDATAETRYRTRADALADTISDRLFDADESIIYGGLDWDGKPVKQNSAHAYSLAILTDLFPTHHRAFLDNQLLPLVRGHREQAIVPSPFFMYYIFEALKKRGQDADVVDCVRRWWGEMVDDGLSTVTEVWDGKAAHSSLCHAWSAHPIVHLSNILLGIRQTAPAWESIRFQPVFSHVSAVSGAVASPLGVIESRWETTGGKIDVSLSLPPGIRAEIVLPGVRKKTVRGVNRWRINTAVTDTRQKKRRLR